MAFSGGSVVKNPPASAEDVRDSGSTLGQEDPLEEHSSAPVFFRQPTPVFLPGKSHGQRNLVGYSPWGRKESDTTE